MVPEKHLDLPCYLFGWLVAGRVTAFVGSCVSTNLSALPLHQKQDWFCRANSITFINESNEAILVEFKIESS